jgi:nucleoside phosphorylase
VRVNPINPKPIEVKVLTGKLGYTKVGILTITTDEFAAAQRIFNAQQNISGSPYFVAPGARPKQYDIVIRKASDRTNTPASRATSALIEDLRPAFIFLVGTAGGVLKDEDAGTGRDGTRLGDVITADFIDYTEFVKLRGRRALDRKVPHDHPSLYLRENFAEPLSSTTEWHPLIGVPRPEGDETPHAMTGNIAAGEKILSSPTNAYQRHLVAKFDKALAFETESFGVAHQIFCARCSVHYNPQFLVIRGLSDFVNTLESDALRADWTPYAASAALAFTRCIIEKLLANFPVDHEPSTSNGNEKSLRQLISSLIRRLRGD